MIHVSRDQLSQLQYLIQQSIQGNHLLFDPLLFRQAVQSSTAMKADLEELYQVEHHLERMIERPTLAEKRAYLDTLDEDTYRLLIQSYLSIIEDNLLECQGSFH